VNPWSPSVGRGPYESGGPTPSCRKSSRAYPPPHLPCVLHLIPVCLTFALLGRRARPDGFFIGLFFALYGPVRFMLDALRSADVRYYGWTPGQYLSLLAAIAGLATIFAVLRKRGAGAHST
jgi:prolipoprotein diacylglyceryltransferase